MTPFSILLIEDNSDHAELFREMLMSNSDRVVVRHIDNGRSALDYLQTGVAQASNLPDLILMDLNMPGLNGVDVLNQIKNDPHLKKIPVVILSTSGSTDDIERAMLAHANSYATKARNFGELEKLLSDISHYWMHTHAVANHG